MKVVEVFMKKNLKFILLFSFFILVSVIGLSYAFWQLTLSQNGANKLQSACFNIEFKDQNAISLSSTYPITDEKGMSLTPYEFTLSNVCNTPAVYQINLEELENNVNRLNNDYIKVSLNNKEGVLLNSYPSVPPILEESDISHKLTAGVLKEGEEKTFQLRLYLDYNTPPNKEVMNSVFQSKITVKTIYQESPEVEIKAKDLNDSITIDIKEITNETNEELTYFYQLNKEQEIESRESTYTFTGLKDGTYKVIGRAETKDGIVIDEKEMEVTIAYETVYISSYGNDESGNGSLNNPFASLQPSYNKVKSGGEMILLSDITATNTTTMDIENKEVTLKSDNEHIYSIFRGSNLTTQILNITNSNTVTTTNITFDGKNVISISALIEAYNAVLNLNEGTTIENANQSKTTGCAGILVLGDSGILNLKNVYIQNNYHQGSGNEAAGVYVGSGAICNMYSGVIQNNHAGEYGGGIYVWEATLNIFGGSIINNSAIRYGGGIYAYRLNNPSIIKIYNGTIENNTAQLGPNMYANNGAQIIDER